MTVPSYSNMGWEGWFTIVVVAVLIVGLAREWGAPDLLLVGALAILIVTGAATGSERLPTAAQAVAGFGNPGLLTVAALFVVVAGLVQTQAMTRLTEPLLRGSSALPGALARLMLPVTGLSAFLNNTPVVAMFLPIVEDMGRRLGISPSKLFLPLSYASIFGGVCTLIGTSTNLVVNGLLIGEAGISGFAMFDLAWVGVPCAAAGLLFMLTIGRSLLPDRNPPISLNDDPRQYTVEMLVERDGPLVDRTIGQAGLRHLPGLYLAEIIRGGTVHPAVGSEERLRAGDRVVFVGILDSVVGLRKTPGLSPATDQVFKLQGSPADRRLIEVVVSDRCPIVGRSIREGQFRTKYDAAVIAVARSGRRVVAKIGDIVLRPGDTLLLEARSDFERRHRDSRDFFLVSGVDDFAPPRRERRWLALAVLALMVGVATAGWLDMLSAALAAAVLMIATGCCSTAQARQGIDAPVLVVIGASLGIGAAMESSGAAGALAREIIGLAGGDPWRVLLAVYLVTSLFTEVITNNAAAVLVFPVALASARTLGVDVLPFAMAIIMAASASFATPIGYQTNLMVLGPGGYRFTDYLRVGIPLNVIFLVVTVALTPLMWPFHG